MANLFLFSVVTAIPMKVKEDHGRRCGLSFPRLVSFTIIQHSEMQLRKSLANLQVKAVVPLRGMKEMVGINSERMSFHYLL